MDFWRASTPRGVLLERACRPGCDGRDAGFNPSWGPAGTASTTRRSSRANPLQPLVGSCWNTISSRAGSIVIRLQPLVGSCWNRVTRESWVPLGGASTPRGVLLERHRQEASGSRLDSFNPSWGPAGTACSPRSCSPQVSFNPSWGPAGTRPPEAFGSRALASTPRGVLLEPLDGGVRRATPSPHASTPRGVLLERGGRFTGPTRSLLQPLVGSCWNTSRLPSPRRRSTLQPLVGSCWNRTGPSRRGAGRSLQPLVGSCWNQMVGLDVVLDAVASTPRGVLLEHTTVRVPESREGCFNPSWGPAGTDGRVSRPPV